MKPLRTLAAAGAVTSMLLLSACSSGGDSASSLTFRLWDDQAAEAYESVLPAFEEETGIKVKVEVVPWADYWNTLRNDIASDDAPDVFWTNSSNYSNYADAGKLINVDEEIPTDRREGWMEAAVEQFTWDGTLWGVPALTDPGIAVFYNQSLLDEAGVSVEELDGLAWDPDASTDTLREIASKLTLDSAGNTPDDADFDPAKITQFGYNAAMDTQAIYLNYLGSNGAQYQDEEGFLTFDSPEGVAAFQYIVDLINVSHVSPSAADTNDNGDFSRDQFLQGKMALFQTGSYNLANVMEGADFEWGIVELPKGPAGRISVVNSIVATGPDKAADRDAQVKLLEWIAGPEGSGVLGETGVGLPANTEVQDKWENFWAEKDVDVTAMTSILSEGSSKAPFGPNIQASMEAYEKILKEMFLGRMDVPAGVADAEQTGNAIIEEG